MTVLFSVLDPDPVFKSSGSHIAMYLSLGLHKGRPSYRRSLPPSKKNIQHFKTWTFLIFYLFFGSFLPSWIRIQPTSIQCGSGSSNWSCPLVQGSDGCDEGKHVGSVGGSTGWRQSGAPCREQTHQVYQIIFCSPDLWIRPKISTK